MKKAIITLGIILYSTFIFGQVSIGASEPEASAILDLNINALSSKKGFLGPRVGLSSNTDIITIPNPAVGLMIFNTGTGALKATGYMYWSGTEWKLFSSISTVNPIIGELRCSEAKLSPESYEKDVPYSGTMTIPYSGGNGGAYPAGAPIASTGVTGLTATLQEGVLSHGNGYITYSVTGTPNGSTPEKATFAVPSMFGVSSCSASVGGKVLAIGEAITSIYSIPVSVGSVGSFILGDYVTANGLAPLPTIDGLEINLAGVNTGYYDPRIYNRLTSVQLVSYQTFATQVLENETNLNISLNPGSYLQVDANNVVLWTTNLAEVETTNLQVQIDMNTYRWYEFKWWCMRVVNDFKVFLSVKRVA
ncbi:MULTISPECIES: hypothetical protein [Sphingobacterium]|uniref:hypothetical protein n=1 Tax=Sphingobacterium TaxID=28453 RepID=UPI0013D99D72|nr:MULTISPECIES: hypothetical protein [unclassified Sphingobacterium]